MKEIIITAAQVNLIIWGVVLLAFDDWSGALLLLLGAFVDTAFD